MVIACDNAIPHLLTDEEILKSFRQMHECTRPGGGCLVTVRDYDREERGTGLVKPYGVRDRDGKRYVIFQVRDFEGDITPRPSPEPATPPVPPSKDEWGLPYRKRDG